MAEAVTVRTLRWGGRTKCRGCSGVLGALPEKVETAL